MTNSVLNLDDTAYTFDAHGGIMTRVCYNNPAHRYSYVNVRDESGNILSCEYAHNPDSRYSFVCTYDDRGNLVSRTYGQG